MGMKIYKKYSEKSSWKMLILLLIPAYAAVMYLLGLKCPVKTAFGYECPGCGMTRAVIYALQLDFRGAFEHHSMFWSVPLLFILIIRDGKVAGNRGINRLLSLLIVTGFLLNWAIRVFC